jgi:hypothetical protein
MNIESANDHRAVLPAGYRKHKVIVARYPAPYKAQVRSYWDGGSRYEFTLIRNGIRTGVTQSINPLHPPGDTRIELQAGDVLVQTGIFCGKTAAAIITYVESPVAPAV